MALGRKSSRLCENIFAGIVIFACGLSIIISMKFQAFSGIGRLTQRKTSRELQKNRNTFLTAFKDDGKHDISGNEHQYVSNDHGDDTSQSGTDIKSWFHRKPVHKYMPSKFHPILLRPELMSNSACKDNTVDILIYSLSYWSNFNQRAAIRESWAATDTFTDIKIKTVFFLGRPSSTTDLTKIESENQKYSDIVLGDFLDGHANISMKSLLALQWINSNCLHAKYILKADDDMFVNIFYVIEFGVSEIFTLNKVIMCQVRPNNTNEIIRNRNSKWYVPDHILPGRLTFPTMCFANMILFTADLVPDMYRASFSVPYCTVDDAYIFGMLIEPVKNADFRSIGETISMNQNEAYQDLMHQSHPRYIASTVKQIEYFRKFWNAALTRVPTWAKGRLSSNIKT
ncbi:beta-1,3-galactosyltransferase 5-like [Mizuhopecten yessoensis]|uniref:Hexosyltransferase n=1 Tax=Mizuhopecten yessoensis TaxID=6573 RepID=A0A210Q8Q7_MIZYE|nr:beta-1,3-galactosyltransferase 5-like [Mizuhopecten yessoensis]XP_021364346.1 beta-1,3-galactosyltransferase 5-like [Mizuhopecten yessoensis]OWF45123.1 Beta-1,3-galactosyltransferase 5 [Mizuhopecten yessoensis]